jgi:hypothetical protein
MSAPVRLFLFEFALLVLYVVLMTAAQRAVLRPAEAKAAFLRFGMDELRMLGLCLLLIFVFLIGITLAGVVVTFVAGAMNGTGRVPTGVAIGASIMVAVTGLLLWLLVRLSLIFPLTLLRRRIIIGEAWRTTRGRFWTLFGAYFVLFLVVLAGSIIVGLVTTGSYLLDVIRNVGNPAGQQEAARAELARQASGIDVLTVIGWLLNAAVGAVTIALGGGAVATAVRELTTDEASIAETFA